MGAAHGHLLHYHGHSPLHRAPAAAKIVTLVVFMLIVVATPRPAYLVHGLYAVLLLAAITLARVPVTYLFPRLVIELPFVVYALVVPFVAAGPRIDVLGLSLSRTGLVDAFGLLAKATLGVLAGLLLAATTEPTDLLRGLERLRLPAPLVQIMSFMLRYLDVIGDELRRLRLAALSRGFGPRDPRHWPVLAASLGALFIRSFERGERVYQAMIARGYQGRLPS